MKYCKDYLHYKLLQCMKGFSFESPILEVGCGTGETLEVIPKGFDIKGIDLSDEAVTICQSKGLKVQKADLFGISEKFNSILCIDVIEHVKDDRAFISHLYKILNPNGRLFILAPSGKMMPDDNLFGHYRRYSRDSMVRLLKNSGFVIESSEMFGYPFLYYIRYLLNLLLLFNHNIKDTDIKARTLKSSFEHPADNSFCSRLLENITKSPSLSRLFLRFLCIQDIFANGNIGFAVVVIAVKRNT